MIPPRLSFNEGKACITRQSSKNVSLHTLEINRSSGKAQVKATLPGTDQPRTPSALLSKEEGASGDFSSSVYQLGFSHFKEKYQKLDQQMYQQKNLINMIIHDLRCPTSQISHTAGNQLSSLETLRSLVDELQDCSHNDQELIQNLEDYNHKRGALIVQSHGLSQIQNGSTSRSHKLAALSAALSSSLDLFSDSPADIQLCSTLIQRVEALMKKSSSGSLGSPSPPAELRAKRKLSQNQSSFFKLGNNGLQLSSDSSDSASCHEARGGSERRRTSNLDVTGGDILESDGEANASFCSDQSHTQSRTLFENLCGVDTQQPKLIDEVSTSHIRHMTSGAMSIFNQSLDGVYDRGPYSAKCTFREINKEINQEEYPSDEALMEIIDKLQANTGIKFAALEGISAQINSLAKMTATCEYSSAVLLNLINDLLDLAKAENNAFSINNNFFDLEQSLQEAVHTLEFMAEQKQISTSFQIELLDANMLRSAFSDSGRLKQVLVNLMSNALKFTNEGGNVEVSVQVESSTPVTSLERDMPHLVPDISKLNPQSSIKHSIVIEVKDNGDGISKEGQSKLFKNYASLAEHKEKNERGTGLGLCICKQIIERMEGEISVESILGEGTTFSIKMPILSQTQVKKAGRSLTTPSTMKRIKSLEREVIAENEIEQSSLSSGSLSHSFASGKRMAIRSPALRSPLKSPALRRYQSPLRLQEAAPARSQVCSLRGAGSSRPTLNKTVPWRDIEFTGASSTQKQKFRRQQTFNTRSREQTLEFLSLSDPAAEMCQWGDLSVLIVNDEPVSLMILKQLIQDQLGLKKVQTAHNGKVAVCKAKEESFDIIILDLHMPVLDGFEAARQIKESNSARKPVLVALSASSFNEDLIKQCQEAGFQKQLTAPVSKQQLKEEVFEEFFPQ